MGIGKKFYLAAAGLVVATGALVGLLSVTSGSADAMTITDRRDCGYTDTIIDCGTVSTQELLSAYDRNDDGRGNRDVQAIFHHYGVTRNEIVNTANIKKGWLDHNTGSITVDGKVVGTNAKSLYRVNVPGKTLTPVSIAGKTYYIGNVAGQYRKGADVFVFYKNGKPYTAIQGSCGNPIPFTPKEEPKPEPKPAFKCESLKLKKISRTEYEFTATASAENATIKSYTFNFGDGSAPVTTPNRTVKHTYAQPGSYTAKVTVNVTANGQNKSHTGPQCEVKIKVDEEPKKPVFKCESLTAQKIERNKFRFTATGSATDTEISSYIFNFGDGSPTLTTQNRTVEHTYAQPGSYTAKVSVSARINGQIQTKTGPQCEVKIKVEEKPEEKKPAIEIEKTVNNKEHAKVAVDEEFTYEIVVRNTGNVVLKDAVVTDKAPNQVTLLSSGVGTIANNEWTYTIPELNIGETKQFKIKAKYAKYAEGTHENNVCVDTPTVPGGPVCDDATTETNEPIEVCDLNDNTIKTIQRSEFDESHMTTDLEKCGEIKVCIIEDKVVKVIAKTEYDESTMTTDLSKCEEAPEIPPELPKTGLSTFIGGGIGIGSITAASYYWVASRRNLLSALLDR